jgi:hypothetical protein
MKKIILLVITMLFFSACEKSVEFNNPAMQAKIDISYWKAIKISASKTASGGLKIDGLRGDSTLTLNTTSATIGTYVFGTTNQSNKASYSVNNNGSNYETGIIASSVNSIKIASGGTGYEYATAVPTTSTGAGTGLTLDIDTNTSGTIIEATINNFGKGYTAGDIITVTGGTGDARVTVQNVLKSNGEIVITSNNGTIITGNYKFTAFNQVTGETITCREGVFYNIPLK